MPCSGSSSTWLGRPVATSIEQGEGGSLVSISSVSGVAGAPFHAPYGAAKAGLISLTRSLAIELAPAGIRVNNVAPGAVATPRVVDRLGGRSPDGLPLRSRAPLGRMGEPDEIAKVVVFLSSDLASYVSGQTVDCRRRRHGRVRLGRDGSGSDSRQCLVGTAPVSHPVATGEG